MATPFIVSHILEWQLEYMSISMLLPVKGRNDDDDDKEAEEEEEEEEEEWFTAHYISALHINPYGSSFSQSISISNFFIFTRIFKSILELA